MQPNARRQQRSVRSLTIGGFVFAQFGSSQKPFVAFGNVPVAVIGDRVEPTFVA